jgi:glycosyltransferase involved in cell wall biosynthesis
LKANRDKRATIMATDSARSEDVSLSIVIPITERYDDLSSLYEGYRKGAERTGARYEFIFVIDGHHPAAYRELRALKDRGEKIVIIRHSRLFGESAAINTGVRHSAGSLVMTLPPYLQVDPHEIPKLYGSLGKNDMVIVRRWPRRDSLPNRFQTRLFHFVVKGLTDVGFRDIGCSLRVVRKRVFSEISLYGDLHRFMPILAQKAGFKVAEIDLPQSDREKKFRMYAPGTYVRRLIDLLTVFFLVKFTKKPLRFFGLTGTTVLVLGLAISTYLLAGRLLFDASLSDRPLLLLGVLLIVLGIQIFAIGLVGEIVIFSHADGIKEYAIEEIIN